MSVFPMRLRAIKVSQPMGEFYAVSIPATLLRSIVFLDPTRIESVDRSSFLYRLLGNQREASLPRAKEIAKYIDTVESAFPNSIILAANYVQYGEFQEDPSRRWIIESTKDGDYVHIPSDARMASVIDGQHRLLGFDYCMKERQEMELLCSVYMDLPQTYQAYLFATINMNQRRVNKSLAYEQFGYNLDDEKTESWAPDKLAVFFARKLNLKPKSPLHEHIKITPLEADMVFVQGNKSTWIVSMACIVEGLVSLISARPKADRDLLHSKPSSERQRKMLPQDNAPFRDLYLAGKDDELFENILSFLSIVEEFLWRSAGASSYIRKTIGVQGLFDVYKTVAQRVEYSALQQEIKRVIQSASNIDFSNNFFQASGKGRVRVKNSILRNAGIISDGELPESDRERYITLLS